VASGLRSDSNTQCGSAAGELAREVSALQASLLKRLNEELQGGEAGLFAEIAGRLAEEFGSVTATAVGAVCERGEGGLDRDSLNSLHRPGQMRRRLDQMLEMNRRYGQPFGLVVFAVEGPGVRDGSSGDSRETVLAVVGAALRDSIRLVDEVFGLEEDALCVLAPSQTTVEGVQMADRLLQMLDELESAGGLRITVSAGVVACPEHGVEAKRLLQSADEAMWRARAVGQPVGVGSLQDR
jgi:diguanylate cyclase (GGDEF)-like protein